MISANVFLFDTFFHEKTRFEPASPYAISKCSADLIGRFYAEAYGMKILTTRMFTHTGPRRGDVFAESSFAKQIVTPGIPIFF